MSTSAPKPSLFKPPVWATSQKSTSRAQPNDSVFGRDDSIYQSILDEERKKREKREEKLRARTEKSGDGDQPTKKRRLSKDCGVAESLSDSASTTSTHSSRSSRGPTTRSTPKNTGTLVDGLDSAVPKPGKSSRTRGANRAVINLEDDDSTSGAALEDGVKQSAPKSNSKSKSKSKSKEPKRQSEDSESEEEDEYMRELKLKAREKARLQRLGIHLNQGLAAPKKSASPVGEVRSPSQDLSRPASAHSVALPASTDPQGADQIETTTSAADDVPVVLLITSSIPNSKPLLVNRKASQPLHQVRDFWCTRQGFDKKFSDRVFFTWRDIRLFDSTTMRTVLQTLQQEVNKANDSTASKEELSKALRQISIEAVTPEILEEKQKSKERKTAVQAGLFEDGDEPKQNEAGAAEGPGTNGLRSNNEADDSNENTKKKDGTVLKLTAQGYDSMLMRVRPNTSIDKIMRAFQKERNVDQHKTCWLVFDGDRLDPEQTAAEIGFEHMDEVEVHPKWIR